MDIPDLAAVDFGHLTITGQLAGVERAAAGDPISLIGSSMSGYLAALYAARHPEVARAVLLAPAFGFARRWAESLGAARVEEGLRTGAMYVYHYGEGRDSKLIKVVKAAQFAYGIGSTDVVQLTVLNGRATAV